MNDSQDISFLTPDELAEQYCIQNNGKVAVFGAYNETNDKECIVPLSVVEKANNEPIEVDTLEMGGYRFSANGIEKMPQSDNKECKISATIGGITFDDSEGSDTVEQIANQVNCTIKTEDARANGGIINAPKLDRIGESNKRVIDIFVGNSNKASDSKHAGLRFNSGKLRYDLICPEQLKELARVYTIGAKKYGDHNWQKGQAWTTVLASLERHIALFKQCQDNDDETGCQHMAHAMWNCGALISFAKFYPQGDDRRRSWQRIPKIGLDVDEVLSNFVKGYCARYNLEIPHCWNFDRLMYERMEELKQDKDFWLNLEPLIKAEQLPFEPAAYITSRMIPNEWTQEWLDKHGFPIAPTITVASGSEKAEHIEKLGLDWFIDDNMTTFTDLNKKGICCFLMDAKHNQRYDVGSKRIKSMVELKERW